MIQIGDYVKNRWGENGSVIEEYENFWKTPKPMSMSRQDWLDQQLIPFTVGQLEEKWFTVHCETGGSVLGCESSLELLERPKLDDLK